MKKYHIISHTHWDREWYLTFQQFRMRLVRLVDKLLDILESDPDYKHFMLDGQTIILDDYLDVRPEKEKLLKRYIQEGRILIGPWHILPDMFLVSPESHIRNLLQGDRTAREFGPKMSVGYIPDPFGHFGQTPQILRGFGIDSAALWRGLSDQPAELIWESPDGSSVFLAYLRDSYGNGANLPIRDQELFTQQLDLAGQSLLAHSAINEYLIMLGTDHMEPPTQTSQVIDYANDHLSDIQVLHSTLPEYIKNAREEIKNLDEPLPVVKGELRACDRAHLLPGVLSTRMWIKQRNHYSQNLLEKWSEPFVVFAEALTEFQDQDFKSARATASRWIQTLSPVLRQAWRILMQNHPHDSICGCSIDQVHEEMKVRFDQVDQIGEELILQSLQRLSSVIETQRKDAFSSIVIFNPHGITHSDLVEVEVDLPEGTSDFELVDKNDQVLLYEFIGLSHEELANILVDKKGLRDTIGGANDGWVSGMAIQEVTVTRSDSSVKIQAVLDSEGQPDLRQWQKAEKLLAQYQNDPEIKNFHILAHTPRTSTIRFVSPKIPALGWDCLWLREVEAKENEPPKEVHPLVKPLLPFAIEVAQTRLGEKLLASMGRRKKQKPPFIIENEFYSVKANPGDGTLMVKDKRTGAVFTGLNRFVDGGDAGDTYNYSPPSEDSFITADVENIELIPSELKPSIEIILSLKVPAALDATRETRGKKRLSMPIRTRVSLVPGVARIDVRTEVDNLAKDHRLRVHFPAPFAVQAAYHDGHYEVVSRPVGVPEKGEGWVETPRPEVPQCAFTDISNGEVGLMIANRGLPEVEVLNGTEGTGSDIAMTLLRCVGWLSRGDLIMRDGHAGPALETPGAQMPGKWSFEYAIIPHKGNWLNAYHSALAYQTDLRAIETDLQDGRQLAEEGSFITHTPDEFVISAIKPAEKGEGWILRGYNITSKTLQVRIKPLLEFSKAYRVNLAEEKKGKLVSADDGSILIQVTGHEIVSISFDNN